MIHSIRRRINNYIWRRLDLSWETANRVRLRLDSKSDWYIYNEIFLDGDYDAAIRATLEDAVERSSSPLYLDLGSNVGFFGLRWLHLARESCVRLQSRGIMVEGETKAFGLLRQRLAPQADKEHTFDFHHGLAGKRTGIGHLNISRAHFGNRLGGEQSGFGVDVVSFLDLDALTKTDHVIDLVKCDIEGSEESFLENYASLLLKTQRLVIELHHTIADVQRCKEMIDSAGFTHASCVKDRPEFSVMHYWREL